MPNSLADLPGEHYAFSGVGMQPTGGNCARRKSNCNSPANPSACAVIPPSHYINTCKHCIKIEYYQFSGLNDAHESGIANHEGDLSILTVVYDKDKDAAVGVSHWVHGIEIRYDLTDPNSKCDLEVGQRVCKGINSANQQLLLASYDAAHATITDNPDQIALAQNSIVYFNNDQTNSKAYEHPNVFIELGGHEFWPTANWSERGSPTHNGDDAEHSYLPQNIPNLGELEHPYGELGEVVINYLGLWGATSNSLNNSSPGPSMHTTWNWFLHSPRVPISCVSAEN